jgi:hypothetical protein
MKCPRTKKCPKVNGANILEVIDWNNDKRPLCKKCNKGVDKK